jgi:uncharacterized protein (DUF2141 family)
MRFCSFVFLFVFLFVPSWQNSFAEPTTQPRAKLTIKVIDLRNHKGQLIFGVFDSEKGFPSSEKNAKNWQVRDVDADTMEFTCELPPGRYGASVLHDENKNGEMDKHAIGIPKEGYGVTNNPKPKMRQAKFSESTFDLPPEGTTLTISLQYF